LDSGKCVRANGDNPIHQGCGLIAGDRLLVAIKHQATSRLNKVEARRDIPFMLWANIDQAVNLACCDKC